jgi:hypothetical protein
MITLEALQQLEDAQCYLLEHSGLPGPRANSSWREPPRRCAPAVELRRWASLDSGVPPTGGA